MSPYVVIPLLSCIVCAMLAAILYTRDRKQPANRLASALMGCTAFWAFCEVLWNQSSDAAQVLFLVKLAVFGWAPLGAVTRRRVGYGAARRGQEQRARHDAG